MRSVEVNSSRIYVLGVVKGLVSEEKKVESAIERVSPDAIGLSISKEQLAALRSRESWGEYELSPLESAYKTLMEEFGEVRLPSPAFVKALELGASLKVPVIPIDMNDLEYTETYCEKVGAMDLVREGAFSKSVRRKKFDGSSPEDLAEDWDRRVNKAKGFQELEVERVKHMAITLTRMTSRYQDILALVDYERSNQIIKRLGN